MEVLIIIKNIIIRRLAKRTITAFAIGGIFMGSFSMPFNVYAQQTTVVGGHGHQTLIPINEVIEMTDIYGNPVDVTPVFEQGAGQQHQNQGIQQFDFEQSICELEIGTFHAVSSEVRGTSETQTAIANQEMTGQGADEQPSIPRLFPSNVEELHFENSRRIIRTYELTPYESPQDISTASFEREGWRFAFQEITRTRQQLVSTIDYEKVVEIETTNQNLNTVLQHIDERIEHETEDGYRGVLTLDVGSIQTQSAGTRSVPFTQTETRTFPHLSSPDVSLIPHSITVSGRELTLSNVTWSGGQETPVDYVRIVNTFTATATYSHQGSRMVGLGYVTTAIFRGELTRINEGETRYTALFIGTEIDPASGTGSSIGSIQSYGYNAHGNPVPILGFDDYGSPIIGFDEHGSPIMGYLEANNVSGIGSGGNYNAVREPSTIPLQLILAILGITILAGAGAWFFFVRGNAVVYNLDDGEYMKIGRIKIGKGNKFIANLSVFTDKSKTTAFRIDLPSWSASKLNGETITVPFPLCQTTNSPKKPIESQPYATLLFVASESLV